MNPLREAAQQALEALEKTHTQPGCEQWQAERKASVALRAALEQQEQEPVATVAMDVSGAHLSWNGKYLGQKPDTKIAMLLKDLPVGTLLFTAPPRREWQSLSEEEITDCWTVNDPVLPLVGTITRAIEAALRSKNQ
jgi:hypothetical protein